MIGGNYPGAPYFGQGYAGLTGSATLQAGYGSFTLTGEPAGLGIAMPAANGSFALTGQNAGLTPAIVEGYGVFSLNGQGVTLGISFFVGAGSFTLTGENVPFFAIGLNAAIGHFAVNGQATLDQPLPPDVYKPVRFAQAPYIPGRATPVS